MAQHKEQGKDLSKYHCNTCNENFFIAAEGDTPYSCPFCGSETSINMTARWMVLAPVDKKRMDDEILVIPAS